jgi:hypothetical protein
MCRSKEGWMLGGKRLEGEYQLIRKSKTVVKRGDLKAWRRGSWTAYILSFVSSLRKPTKINKIMSIKTTHQ